MFRQIKNRLKDIKIATIIVLLSFNLSSCQEKQKVVIIPVKTEINPTTYYLDNPAKIKTDALGRVELLVEQDSLVSVYPDSVFYLRVADDFKDERFPTEVFFFKNLRFLWVGMRAFKTVPPEINTLEYLEELDFQHGALQVLPKEIGDLKHLKRLIFLFCCDLKKLPDEICNLKNLEYLNVSFTEIKSLPACLQQPGTKPLEVVGLKNKCKDAYK